MRIAFLVEDGSVNGFYRCTGPMRALGARGHDVRQVDAHDERGWAELLRWCEVVHIHRICDEGVVDFVRGAQASGAAVVWDDDDDVTSVPKEMKAYRRFGGVNGQRYLAVRRKLFELVDVVTTPSEWLAESFRAAGAPRVRVIENYVADEFMGGERGVAGAGVTIGWIAGSEHRLDLARLPIAAALERLLDAHADVHVRTIGVALQLRHERYEHRKAVPFPQLLGAASAFDLGIAPLSDDLAMNRARSNVKLKEYAAAGVPWLASPIGPYVGLGEKEGGRLVPDDRWYEQLEQLVANARARRRLAKRAARWGREQTIARNAHRWEQELSHAIEHARAA